MNSRVFVTRMKHRGFNFFSIAFISSLLCLGAPSLARADELKLNLPVDHKFLVRLCVNASPDASGVTEAQCEKWQRAIDDGSDQTFDLRKLPHHDDDAFDIEKSAELNGFAPEKTRDYAADAQQWARDYAAYGDSECGVGGCSDRPVPGYNHNPGALWREEHHRVQVSDALVDRFLPGFGRFEGTTGNAHYRFDYLDTGRCRSHARVGVCFSMQF